MFSCVLGPPKGAYPAPRHNLHHGGGSLVKNNRKSTLVIHRSNLQPCICAFCQLPLPPGQPRCCWHCPHHAPTCCWLPQPIAEWHPAHPTMKRSRPGCWLVVGLCCSGRACGGWRPLWCPISSSDAFSCVGLSCSITQCRYFRMVPTACHPHGPMLSTLPLSNTELPVVSRIAA